MQDLGTAGLEQPMITTIISSAAHIVAMIVPCECHGVSPSLLWPNRALETSAFVLVVVDKNVVGDFLL